MKFKLMVLLLLLSSSYLSAKPVGLGDVIEIKPRDDGKFNVVCSYGAIELGVTFEEILAGNVCEEGNPFKNVKLVGIRALGRCSFNNVYVSPEIRGSRLEVSQMHLDAKDSGTKACFTRLLFDLPEGYRIGIKKFKVGTSVFGDKSHKLRLRVGGDKETNQPNQEIIQEAKGNTTTVFSFSEPIYSECGEKRKDRFPSFYVSLSISNADRENKIEDLVKVRYFDLFEPVIEKCE